jgi:hypothetical protein
MKKTLLFKVIGAEIYAFEAFGLGPNSTHKLVLSSYLLRIWSGRPVNWPAAGRKAYN